MGESGREEVESRERRCFSGSEVRWFRFWEVLVVLLGFWSQVGRWCAILCALEGFEEEGGAEMGFVYLIEGRRFVRAMYEVLGYSARAH